MVEDKNEKISRPSEPTAMFSPELPIGAAQFQVEANRRIGRTCSAIVNRFRVGEEDNLFSCLAETIAPVNVLSVHEEVWIQRPDTLDCISSRQHKPAIKYFHWTSRLMIEVGHQETAKKAGLLEQDIKSHSSAEVIPVRRKAHSGTSYSASCEQHLWTN
jgi:hypothetical protein